VQGEPVFDDVGTVLDLIASLPVRVVIPGHGAPFTGVAGVKADPVRHLRVTAERAA
jgi:hypothetical protein